MYSLPYTNPTVGTATAPITFPRPCLGAELPAGSRGGVEPLVRGGGAKPHVKLKAF